MLGGWRQLKALPRIKRTHHEHQAIWKEAERFDTINGFIIQKHLRRLAGLRWLFALGIVIAKLGFLDRAVAISGARIYDARDMGTIIP
ncbi:hypothetical protein ASPFODRAFT_208959 [Aspergillus luchuensis CBS 106.47]|uniref:Uncharacterized protein n=1 Tax=Aspergillus luchuensis (strain CBS 106.47) TaxID=1137211 RepID=A0A1M3TCI3_ASPLC|nr:hypothetical protein ASPFODRAFT_208959 [Aspergillus luchuensis CBS 106.47]